MGVQKKTRKFAVAKRTIQLRDSRLLVPTTPPLLRVSWKIHHTDWGLGRQMTRRTRTKKLENQTRMKWCEKRE